MQHRRYLKCSRPRKCWAGHAYITTTTTPQRVFATTSFDMDPTPHSPSRRREFPWPKSPRLGRYEHVAAPSPDDGRPQMAARTHSIPRKPVPQKPTVSTTEKSSAQSSTYAGSDVDFDRKPSEELHRDSVLYLAFSVVAALLPCGAIALAIMAAQLEGKPISEWGDKVQSALLLVGV